MANAEITRSGDFHFLIRSAWADSAGEAIIGVEYARFGREFGMEPNFEKLSTPGKLHLLHDREVGPPRIPKFLDLRGDGR